MPSADTTPPPFARTRWSLINTLRGDRADDGDALADLARQYGFPVYAWLRRQGHAMPAAFALTSGFFATLPRRMRDEPPDPKLRFRRYLVAQLQAFLAAGALTTDAPFVAPWRSDELERQYVARAGVALDPLAAFERDFAGALLARALQQLAVEARQGGRSDLFERLLPMLSEDPVPGQCEQIARATHMSALAVSVALKRLRQRFRELIDEELARSVGDPRSLDDERRDLLNALMAPSP